MKSDKKDNKILMDIALEHYLTAVFLYKKSYFIEKHKKITWAFHDVQKQLSFVKMPVGNKPEIITEIKNRLKNRRAKNIRLISYGRTEQNKDWKDDLFVSFRSKVIIYIPKIRSQPGLVEFDFKQVDSQKKIRYAISLLTGKLDYYKADLNSYGKLIGNKSFKSFLIHDHEDQPIGCLGCFYKEGIILIEIVPFLVHYDYHKLMKALISKMSNIDDPGRFAVLIMDSGFKNYLNGYSFKTDHEINFYIKSGRLLKGEVTDCKYNSILKTKSDYINALNDTYKLGIPKHGDLPKNWDSLAALSIINYEFELKKIPSKKHINILDAGGEYYSVILHQLAAYGFKELHCINISFTEKINTGTIKYTPGDITKTNFNDRFFDFVTCLSVLEHGVNIQCFFKEMSRVIKPGGVLIVSTDYWKTKIDNTNKVAYGMPVKIFNEYDVLNIIKIAEQNGMRLIDQVDLKVKNPVITWEELKYTFIYFSFRRI